jgi:hypothetical protein
MGGWIEMANEATKRSDRKPHPRLAYLGFSLRDFAMTIECNPSSIELACASAVLGILGNQTRPQKAREQGQGRGMAEVLA